MKAKMYLLLAVLVLSCTFTVSAKENQQRTVTGVVVDNQSDPLPGVTILIEGTSQGTLRTLMDNILSWCLAMMPFWSFRSWAMCLRR